MKRIFVLAAVFLVGLSVSFGQTHQKSDKRESLNVSCPEKWWVIMHPFVAGRAFKITMDVMKTTDSLTGIKNSEFSFKAQQADAFKHAFWMASLVQEIHWRKALALGNAHERGNYRTFRKNLRKGIDDTHDEAARQMDLWNNRVGLTSGIAKTGSDKKERIETILDSLESGALKVIRTNAAGKFVDCNGNGLPEVNYRNKWINDKCLVNSNFNE